MNAQLNRPQIMNLIKCVEVGKDDEEIGHILNIAPETAARYRASFCSATEPEVEDDEEVTKKAPAKKAPTRKRKR